MNQLLFYLLQVIAASGLLYGYYHLALRNKRFHRYNRFYLLMAIVISSFIPFLNIPVYFPEKETESSVMLQTLQVISSPSLSSESPVVSTPIQTESITASWFTTENVIYLFYLFILSFFLTRFFISLHKIRFIIKKNPAEQIDKIKFINTDEPGTPFSFFSWLFWNRKIELHSEKGEQIFRHELFHIQQKHTWDIILMEFISTIFWINPFFHIIKKELKAIHEFLADEFAIKEDKNWQYAELLLMQVLNTNTHLVNPFFHNQIKRRIAMITSSTKPSYQYLRKLMVLPVAAIIVTLFAFNYQNKRIDPQEFEKAINSITVVIDAGHGGTDAGAKTRDGKNSEAKLTLAIAKKIETLGHEYNINVIMTREDEKFPFEAINKNDALGKRVEFVNNLKPNAFITIHMNSSSENEQSSKSGFDAYVTNKGYNLPDVQLASSVLGELKKIYTTNGNIKQRGNASIYVIDKANYPSLLLECGYINNPKDMSFVTNEKNQEKIAKAILKGIVTFANNITSDQRLNRAQVVADTSKQLQNALVVINGEIQEKRGIQNIDSTKFPNKEFKGKVRVFEGKEAINKYGEKGKDGVIEFFFDQHGDQIIDTIPKVDSIYMPPPAKKSPTQAQLDTWKDSKIYGVWIDANRISNTDLQKYKPSEFGWYHVSKLTKTEVNYGKYYFQISLYTQKYYDEKIAVDRWILFRNVKLLDTTKPNGSQPLIVIDDKIMADLELRNIDNIVAPADIERIDILKNKSPIDKYGDKAKNGVIEIITKKITVKEITLTEKKYGVDEDNKIFEKMEIDPSFPGGEKAWGNFLIQNLNADVGVKNNAPNGTAYTVVVQFIVDTLGNISDLRPLTKHGYGMEDESLRLMRLSPNWIPGIQNGHKAKGYQKQKITFYTDAMSKKRTVDLPVFAYMIDPEENSTIKLNDFKKVKQLKLEKANSVLNCELISFKIIIEKSDPVKFYKFFAIKGNNFPDELLRAINDLDSETIITIEDIEVKVDNQIKRLLPRIYQVNSITTTPD